MTGAQDAALARLAKRKQGFKVKAFPRTGEVKVEWLEAGKFGQGPRTVRADVTPQGRVIEQP